MGRDSLREGGAARNFDNPRVRGSVGVHPRPSAAQPSVLRMKKLLPSALALTALGLGTPLLAQSPAPSAPAASPAAPVSPNAPKTDLEKTSYAIGLDIVRTLKGQGIDIDASFLAAAIRDASTGGQMAMTPEQVQATLGDLQKVQMAKRQAQMAKVQESRKAAGETNVAEGKKFLEENKGKPGVTTLADGLQYKVLTQGNGATPKTTDTVTVNYRGTLIDGTEFDSSYKRGEPATFPVSGVIKGWTEILQQMKVGSKYQVFIPSDLAYGERGAGQDIGPNATLIFDVELLGIKDEAATPAASPAK